MVIEDKLRVILIIGGLIFTTLSFLVIFTGKKVGDDDQKKNVIKFRGLEFKANSILMLVFISMLFCIVPLALPYFVSKPTDLGISGTVQDKEGNYLRNVSVELYEKTPGKKERILDSTVTKGQGNFSFLITDITKGEAFYLKVKHPKVEQTEAILPIHGKAITIDTSSDWAEN